jgi:hypothetical protein
MKSNQTALIALLLIFLTLNVKAQEFKLNVTVAAPRLQLVDAKVFQTLEKEAFNFFNNTKWTDNEFEDHEKIEGNVNITITEELNATTFTADFFVQAIRPVFNSNYKSQIINYVDKGITISYVENQPIQNSRGSYIDPLSSLCTFYAYMMLGYDHDTFESYGGDPYFQIAQNIINNLPASISAGTGWDQNVRSPTSRFNVIENLLDPRARPYRQAIYEYHLKSLDNMHADPGKSRAIMVSAITATNQVNTAILNSGIIQMFCDSKREEIIEIFKGGDKGQQTKVYDMMVKMDPARTSDYAKMR